MSGTRKHPKYEKITARWGGMDIRHEFSQRIDLWLSAFDESERPLLLDLLGQFYYYSENKMHKKSVELYQKFKSEYPDENPVVYIPINKPNGVSFSYLFFDSFWLENELYDYAELDISDLLQADEVPESIVIVDDYTGTGKSFISTLQTLIEINSKIVNSRIYFLIIHATKRAVDFISSFSKEVGISISVISLDNTEEIFKGDYLYKVIEAEKIKLGYTQICQRVKTNSDYILGFEEVQSLVAFQYNTPNNTLGLFWQDLNDFSALFPRHKKRRTTLSSLQRKVKKQAEVRKSSPVVFGIEDHRLAAFMAYCISQKDGFLFETAAKDFGFTEEQLSDTIRLMTSQEYVVIDEGRFLPTAKLKAKMFTSRLSKVKNMYKIDEKVASEPSFNQNAKYMPTKFSK